MRFTVAIVAGFCATLLPGAGAASAGEEPSASRSSQPGGLPVKTDETNAGLDLPADADRSVDQREHVRSGFYVTRAGVRAPLPAEGGRPGEEGSAGVPGMKLD